jgi:hypothetical protein
MIDSDSSIRLEMDSRKFMRQIERWHVGDPPFQECLLTGLVHLSLFHDRPTFIRVLADEFEVQTGTVLRWIQGVERPHFLLQRRVVAAVYRELELALTPSVRWTDDAAHP